MFSLNGTLKKKWVSRAMGNKTIYWDSLNKFQKWFCYAGQELHVFIIHELYEIKRKQLPFY